MMQDSTPVALLKIVAMICWAIPAAMGLARFKYGRFDLRATAVR